MKNDYIFYINNELNNNNNNCKIWSLVSIIIVTLSLVFVYVFLTKNIVYEKFTFSKYVTIHFGN